MHEITLDGYAAQCAEQPIRLGTAGSYGVETLSVMRKGEWVDYDIIVAFHPPKGESVQIRLESDNVVSVPAEATAVAGTGELTFAGYTDGVRQISVSQIYRVAVSAGTEGIAPAEPTPDVVQQILSAANEADSKSEQAQKVAQSVRDDADAGKFNGPQGPKGDTGPQGPVGPQGPKGDTGPAVALDTTLTHEGEAADAKATGDAISAVKARLDEIPKIDDTAITTTSPWSSKQIIDTLCPPLEESGNPVVCYPVAGYPLGMKAKWEPVQEGSGTPSPENIRPIKGRDSVTITRQEDNQVITLTLPETVYGGEVDVATGEGQQVWKSVTLDGTENWNTWGVNKNNATVTGFYTYDINDYSNDRGDIDKILCSAVLRTTSDIWGGKNVGIGFANAGSSRYLIYCVKTDTLSDTTNDKNAITSFETFLDDLYTAGTPVQVAYVLNEPVSFTATGAQPIPALSGTNTLLTDADSVSVSGRADLIHIIRKMQECKKNEDEIN